MMLRRLSVLVVVLESGLAVLFNWRPFVETFNARAVKPLLSFAAACPFVRAFPSRDLVTAGGAIIGLDLER